MAARKLFTTSEAEKMGMTRAELRWGERKGLYRHCDRNVWAEGGGELTAFDRARAAVLARGGLASGMVTAALLGFDAVNLRGSDVTTDPRIERHAGSTSLARLEADRNRRHSLR